MDSTGPTVEYLKAEVEDLQQKVSLFAVVEQNLKNTHHKLDVQIEKFADINRYAVSSFQIREERVLLQFASEGIVDIFQLEIGAMYALDYASDKLRLAATSVPDADLAEEIDIPAGWLDKYTIFREHKQGAIIESPVENAPWRSLGFYSVIFVPLFNNEHQLFMLAVGGITNENKDFYDFRKDELLSSFMVYCQLMGGVLNNIASMRKANEASLAKSRFLANLSHEIRTPMNAIIGMTQIARRASDIAKVGECVEQIAVSSKHLLSLINDVLDISKIEEGKLSLDTRPFDLKKTLGEALAAVSYQAQEKKQRLSHDYGDFTFPMLSGDEVRLLQVLINLLSNAVKFTPELGAVSLRLEQLKRERERVYLRFAVSDTGIGIPNASLEDIFSPFQQVDSSISRNYGGTGLGLAISGQIVGLMGGKLDVESEEGKGSVFSFSVWFDKAPAEEPLPGSESPPAEAAGEIAGSADNDIPNFSGYNLMVVDDIKINREILESLVEDTGIHIENAENGQEALDMFLVSPQGHYSIIFMDVQMPVMDGCSASKAIRKSAHPDAKSVPIVAMTANVFKEDVEAVITAGMNGHVGKPVDHQTLISTMIKYIEPAS